MNPTRRGFLIRAAAVGSAVLGRGVSALLTGRSRVAYAATIHSGQNAVTHGPFLGHLTLSPGPFRVHAALPGC